MFVSVRDERVKMLDNSCVRDLDGKGMSMSRKSCAAGPREGGRHAVSKFKRAISVNISIEDRKRGKIATEFRR